MPSIYGISSFSLPSAQALSPLLPIVTKVAFVASICFALLFTLRHLLDRYVLPSISRSGLELSFNDISPQAGSDQPTSPAEAPAELAPPANPAQTAPTVAAVPTQQQPRTMIDCVNQTIDYFQNVQRRYPTQEFISLIVETLQEAIQMISSGANPDNAVWDTHFSKITQRRTTLAPYEMALATVLALSGQNIEEAFGGLINSEDTVPAPSSPEEQLQMQVLLTVLTSMRATASTLMFIILERGERKLSAEESARFSDPNDYLYRVALAYHYTIYYTLRHSIVRIEAYSADDFYTRGSIQNFWREEFNDIQRMLSEKIDPSSIKPQYQMQDTDSSFKPPKVTFKKTITKLLQT
jgi:hypothetical protein